MIKLKRMLSLVLAFVMTVSLFSNWPMPVFATSGVKSKDLAPIISTTLKGEVTLYSDVKDGAPSVDITCEEEIKDMKEQGVYIAHSPESNMNVVAGIAPIRKYIQEGLHVGLASDVAGGTTENLFTAMMHAIQASKLRWRLVDDTLAPLTAPEVFYMATKGGGEFFGKVGSFEKGYEFGGWYYDETFILEALPNDLVIKDTTLYALYASLYDVYICLSATEIPGNEADGVSNTSTSCS